MISSAVEAKRRLAWEIRLRRSSLVLEVDEGERNALWVYDTLSGPDGYRLRDLMHMLARREGLRLYSFGPRERAGPPTIAPVLQVMRRGWRGRFREQVSLKVAEAAAQCEATLFVVGAAKGTFASALPGDGEQWEMQHGLLDPSYFPVSVDRFFTRSSTSSALLKELAPDVPITEISSDLSPPAVATGDLARARAVVCFSKNPGGGISAADLARFERATAGLAERLGLPFQIRLHPRDNRLKLTIRHRGPSVNRWLRPVRPLSCPRLVVSSFSTALTSESRADDLVLNVALSASNRIVAAEYAWVPTVDLADLLDISTLPAVRRR